MGELKTLKDIEIEELKEKIKAYRKYLKKNFLLKSEPINKFNEIFKEFQSPQDNSSQGEPTNEIHSGNVGSNPTSADFSNSVHEKVVQNTNQEEICENCLGMGYTQPAYLDGEYCDCDCERFKQKGDEE